MAHQPNSLPGDSDPFDTPSNRQAFREVDGFEETYPRSINSEGAAVTVLIGVALLLLLALLVRLL